MTHDGSPVRVKVCGITRPEDARAAMEAGVHALGFVFHPGSPRCVTIEQAAGITRTLPPFVATVGVFVNRPPAEVEAIAYAAGIHVIQLHGDEAPSECHAFRLPVVKAFRFVAGQGSVDFSSYPRTGLLVDSAVPGQWGGTGIPSDWEELGRFLDACPADIRSRIILAGGLTKENVGDAIRIVRPAAVDVSSGVEDEPGIKSGTKLKEFMNAVRTSDRNNRVA